jgi:hypothetical protein
MPDIEFEIKIATGESHGNQRNRRTVVPESRSIIKNIFDKTIKDEKRANITFILVILEKS